jgi:Uma2 family endonuclease
MATLVRITQIETLQGQRTVLHDIDWQQYETFLEDLGESYTARITYLKGILEIEMPLPEHEKAKALISFFVQALLDEMEIDFEPFASTTFRRKDILAGLEPDDCFYIQNNVIMRGVRKLNLPIDPPPDLAIEIDLTSKTKFQAYQAIAVPELWIYVNSTLQIYLLKEGEYEESEFSPTFGNIPVREMFPIFIEQSFTEGRSAAVRAFRVWAKRNIEQNVA